MQEIDLSDSFLRRDSIHAIDEDADAFFTFFIDTFFFCIFFYFVKEQEKEENHSNHRA